MHSGIAYFVTCGATAAPLADGVPGCSTQWSHSRARLCGAYRGTSAALLHGDDMPALSSLFVCLAQGLSELSRWRVSVPVQVRWAVVPEHVNALML